MENQVKMGSSLEGKRVVILGGSSGLGLATAKAAASEGAKVVIVSGNPQKITKALGELPKGSEGHPVNLNIESNIRDLFDRIGAFDHLVYTVGENLNLKTIAETDLEQAHSFFNLRYWGALAAIKYGAPQIHKGGSISLISGTANARPGKGWALASSICGAVEGLVRAMAVELAPIRVNSVVPGVIRTDLWDSMSAADRDGMYSYLENSLLLKRVGEPEDVALAFVYLMKQKYGTGQNIMVEGGTVLV